MRPRFAPLTAERCGAPRKREAKPRPIQGDLGRTSRASWGPRGGPPRLIGRPAVDPCPRPGRQKARGSFAMSSVRSRVPAPIPPPQKCGTRLRGRPSPRATAQAMQRHAEFPADGAGPCAAPQGLRKRNYPQRCRAKPGHTLCVVRTSLAFAASGPNSLKSGAGLRPRAPAWTKPAPHPNTSTGMWISRACAAPPQP